MTTLQDILKALSPLGLPSERVYLRGAVCLLNIDNLEVLPLLPEGCIDCTVTSPPYNQLEDIDAEKLTGIWGIKGATGKPKGAFANNGYFDGLPELEYQQQQNRAFALCATATRDGGSLFYNHQIRWRDGVLLHPVDWFRPAGWNLRQEIIWDRGGGMMFNARMFCRFDERILWFTRGRHKWNQTAVGYGTIWRIAREQNKEHPVAFPLDIPLRCLEAATDAGDVVFETYAGSATVGVACIQTGRAFIGCELDEEHFKTACRRLDAEFPRTELLEPSPPRTSQASLFPTDLSPASASQ